MDGLNFRDDKGTRLDSEEVGGWGSRPAERLPGLCASHLRGRAQAIVATIERFEALTQSSPAARIARTCRLD